MRPCATAYLDIATPFHLFALPVLVTSVQVAPESLDVQMLPSHTTAICLVPSLRVATRRRERRPVRDVRGRDGGGEGVRPCATAYLDIATSCHCMALPTLVSSVQVAPESLDLQMLPPELPSTTAVRLVPSLRVAPHGDASAGR